MEDDYKSLLFSHDAPCDVIRKCMPELVRRLDLESVMDHIIPTDLLTKDELKEYEEKKKTMVQKQLKRWFLRNIVLKGSNKVLMVYVRGCHIPSCLSVLRSAS